MRSGRLHQSTIWPEGSMTRSTALPISMQDPDAGSGKNTVLSQNEESAALPRALKLMGQLLASLTAGHRDLLALDLAGMQRRTGEQEILARGLNTVLGPSLWAEPGNRLPGDGMSERSGLTATDPELIGALAGGACSILQASRLHAALLRRAQHRLRVIANTLAGSSVDYGPLMNGIAPALALPRGRTNRTA
jgi:hypothetical protein